jgi:hypothetical protein
MTPKAMLQLKKDDIVAATLETGYLIFMRVAYLDHKGVHGPRVYNTPDARQSKRQYVVPASRIKKLIRRRDERGFDIPA